MINVSTDILIVGGGSAGIAAAVSAAEEGYGVCLIERNDYLGGKATAAEVGTICGLYKFSKNEKTEFVTGGFAKEFALKLAQLSNTSPLNNVHGLHYLPYDIEKYKSLSIKFIENHKVNVYFNSDIISAQTNNKTIMVVVIKTIDKEIHISCKSVIDCSGNSHISQLTHSPLITSDNYQAAAQVFTLEGINPISELALGLLLIKEIKKAVVNNTLTSDYEKLYLVQGSIKNNKASFKLAVPATVTEQELNSSFLRDVAVEMISCLVNYLNTHVDFFKNSKLFSIAPETGIRTGVRPIGKYILSENDVLTCKKFESGIANGAWPIEEWGQNKQVKMRYFNENDFYQIPADCLKSIEITNLFFAGRNISADDGAIASARVMGICFQTGYAAGKLAANFISGNAEIKTIASIREKQVVIAR
ncbi:FAD-dependent oxidoreductase [Aurantibacillus circumpalustris]|uniref:FAD-dependent oxidoreductase n=1 Tax=Aurantibacillus circumpalustris TaxID=3036359 RepID=UPI00295C159C|nr:FAD-dependent oxidoreductase [Aurantibacillus circumpalustris]